MNTEHNKDADFSCIRSAAAVGVIFTSFVCFLARLRFSDKHEELSIPRVTRGRVSDQPHCSFDVFRSVLVRSPDGYLPGTGTWKRTRTNRIIRFYPKICRLKYGKAIPSHELISCLRGKKLRNIVILGDSNGRRYYDALLWQLRRSNGVRCTQTNISPVNWINGPNTHLVYRCTCGQSSKVSGRCAMGFRDLYNRTRPDFRHARCHFHGARSSPNFSVIIEFTYVLQTLNKGVTYTNYTACHAGPGSRSPVIRTDTIPLAEFLFGEFYASPRPDLVVFFDNAHDRMLLSQLEIDMNQVAELIDRFVRPPTKLIWVSRVAEDVRRKPKYWRDMLYENGTMTRNQWIAAANRIMFRKMSKLFLSVGKPMLFPALLEISEPVLDQYNIDGVHMKPVWYQHVVAYILQAFCSDS